MKNKDHCDDCNGPCIYGPPLSEDAHIIDNSINPDYCTKCNGSCKLVNIAQPIVGFPLQYVDRLQKAYQNGVNSIGTFTAHGRGLNFMRFEMARIVKELEEQGY